MSNVKSGVRTFGELSAALQARAGSIKVAAQKNAAENDPTPEKDPTEKGQVSIPKDPDAKPSKQNTPESKTNADGVTKVLPAPAPAKTVTGEEKVSADLAAKAAKVAEGIKGLANRLTKKSEVTQPNMPPNEKKNEGSDGGALKPPSGGAGDKNNPDPAVKDAAPAAAAMPEDKNKAKTVPTPPADSKGEMPADKTNVDAKAAEGGMCKGCGKPMADCTCEKSASEIPLDPSFHIKLSSIILSTEEGRAFAHSMVEKYHGAQAANDIVKAATIMEEKAEELAALEESGALVAEEMWKSASAEDQAGIIKLAEVMAFGRDSYQTEHEKLAYDAGAGAAAELADQGMLGQEAAPEGAGMDESIMAALEQMVQSGEITPEIAAEILQALQGAGGAGGGGMPPGAEGGGGMPPGAEGGGGPPPPPEEEEPEGKSAANRAAIAKLFPAPTAKAA
jgi:hypothetical protein